MIEATLKNGTLKVTEYFIMEIDEYGDSQNVDAHDTLKEAREKFNKWTDLFEWGETKAIVLERRIVYHPLWAGETRYHVFQTAGDKRALRQGGWIL